MNPLKQALNHLKADWSFTFTLGFAATAFVLLVRYIPYVSTLLISMGLLYLQEISHRYIQAHSRPKNWGLSAKAWLSYLITSVILLPTGALLGSGMGLLQSPQSFLTAALLAWSLLFLAVYFYLILCHSLHMSQDLNQPLAKAIDLAALGSVKKFNMYFQLSFYLSFLILLSALIYGLGLIITLPVIFFSTHFAYDKMKTEGTWTPQKK